MDNFQTLGNTARVIEMKCLAVLAERGGIRTDWLCGPRTPNSAQAVNSTVMDAKFGEDVFNDALD